MLSWIRTLLVLHLVKSVNCLLDTCINLDRSSLLSKSIPRSKILIASTRLGSGIRSTVILVIVVEAYETPDFDSDSIIVSEKFFSPAGWINLPTGSTLFSHSIGLSIV